MAGFITASAGRSGEVHTSLKNPLMTVARDTDGREFIYLQGVASTVAGSWVTFDEDGVTALIDSGAAASIKGPVAVATAAVDATTEYGWYQIYGQCATANAISGGAAADNGKVFATSTAGSSDDVAVTGNQIHGAIYRSAEGAVTAGKAEVQLNYPFIGVTDAII